MVDSTLSLPEELLLLSTDNESGHAVCSASTALPFGLAGAALIELALAGHVRLEDKQVKTATNVHPPADEVLAQVLEVIRSSERTRSIQHWITKVGGTSGKLKDAWYDRLVRKHILEREEGRVLLIFPTRRYPEMNPRPEIEIRDRIRAVALGGARAGERTAALISLVHACSLAGGLFEKDDRKEGKRRIKEISKGEPVGSSVSQAVAATIAAVVAATSAASTGAA